MGVFSKSYTNNNDIGYSKFNIEHLQEVQEKDKNQKIKYDYETIRNIVTNAEDNNKLTKNNNQKQQKRIIKKL